MPPIHLHDLRHTHGTLQLATGTNLKVVAERLGHSSIKITGDTHAHVVPGLQQDAVIRLAEAIDV